MLDRERREVGTRHEAAGHPRRSQEASDDVPRGTARQRDRCGGHGGTYWEPNGGRAAAAVVAWLNWQLRGDALASRTFVGKDCGLCVDAAWKIEKKRID